MLFFAIDATNEKCQLTLIKVRKLQRFILCKDKSKVAHCLLFFNNSIALASAQKCLGLDFYEKSII